MNYPPPGGYPPGPGSPPGGYPPPGYGAPPMGYGGAPAGYGAPQANPYAPPQASPYGMPGAGMPGAMPQQRTQHPKAMTALILGGVSWFFGLWLICSVPAWIIGANAVREIRANPHLYSGESEAKIGMWLGIVHTLLGAIVVLGIIAAVFVFAAAAS